jgi:hypothetical protein
MDLLTAYVNPQGPLPGITGTKRGKLLIMGTGACLWDDLEAYDAHHEGDRMGINEASQFYPFFYSRPLTHAVSLHPEFLWGYCIAPDFYGAHRGFVPLQSHAQFRHRSGSSQHPLNLWPLMRDGGTSGPFGVLIGLLMGYEKIILAGMPQDGSGYFYNAKHPSYFHHDAYVEEWGRLREDVPMVNERVRSLSGNSKIMFGAP